MKVKPFGMQDSDKHESLFDPAKPVTINFWGMDKFGFALGFVQNVGRGRDEDPPIGARFFGGVFFNRIRPLEWAGGDIKFGEETRKKFIQCFREVYGVLPNISPC